MKKSNLVTACFTTMMAAAFLLTACGGSDDNEAKNEKTVTTFLETTSVFNDPTYGYVDQGNGDNYAVDIFTDEAVENQETDADYQIVTHKKGEVVTDNKGQPVTKANGEKQTYSGKEQETKKINNDTTQKSNNKTTTKPSEKTTNSQNGGSEDPSKEDGVWTDFY